MIEVSVIIPTRDRAVRLATCLESIARQTMAPERFEVIVVDNGSTDRTEEVAHDFSARLNLIYVSEPKLGLHYGRHAGLRKARADILLFADDDLVVESGWVSAAHDVLADGTVALAGGNLYPEFEAAVPDWLDLWWSRPVYRGRALAYLSILDFGRSEFEMDPSYVWGANFCVRRQALEAVGGFHPDGMPRALAELRGDGESYTARAIHARGGRVRFNPGISVHHVVSRARMDPAYFENRARAQGISDSYTHTRRKGGPSGRLSSWCIARSCALRRQLIYRAESRGPGPASASAQLLQVQLAAVHAWADGYVSHQASIRRDPDLKKWILRENYL